jgi:hypothetical protein
MTPPPQEATLFDAAKAIVATLKGMDKAQQEQVLRWVSESLGLLTRPTTPIISPAVAVRPSEVDAATPPPILNPVPPETSSDIRTFVRSKNPSSDIQLSAAVAYYYRFRAPAGERRETINAAGLVEAIRLIGGWEQPPQPRITLHNAKKQGYLDAAGKGEFKINSVGENLVNMTMGGDGGAADPRRMKSEQPRKTGKRKTSR